MQINEEASKEPLKPAVDPLEKVDPPGEECNDEPDAPKKKKEVDPYAYRHYTTYHPCCNKLMAMKWDQTLRRQHLKKLSAVKPTIDNSAPKPYMHLQVKLKKLQMEQGINNNHIPYFPIFYHHTSSRPK